MKPYNPLDKRNLGVSVANALLESPVHPLGGQERFPGSGVYAIYYVGGFDCYRALSRANAEARYTSPIYVGKAIPAGGRKGNVNEDATHTALWKRLREHASSIDAVENLGLEDFLCRYLVVDDIWIPLGESLLITKFCPLWNKMVDGFGNHDPGSGRHRGKRSRWDVLHPGRPWAEKCQPREETRAQIAAEVENWLAANATLIEANLEKPKLG